MKKVPKRTKYNCMKNRLRGRRAHPTIPLTSPTLSIYEHHVTGWKWDTYVQRAITHRHTYNTFHLIISVNLSQLKQTYTCPLASGLAGDTPQVWRIHLRLAPQPHDERCSWLGPIHDGRGRDGSWRTCPIHSARVAKTPSQRKGSTVCDVHTPRVRRSGGHNHPIRRHGPSFLLLRPHWGVCPP